jgi:hypothetical protein
MDKEAEIVTAKKDLKAKSGSKKLRNVKNTETEEKVVAEKKSVAETPKPKKNTKKRVGIAIFVIGMLSLVAGIVLMLVNLLAKPAVRDADFIVSVGTWEREDAPGVIWDFTEIGKGKLTTNNHKNDYDFIWSLDAKTLKIETSWLYEINNEYNYTLNQDDKILTLSIGEGESLVNINFHPASSVDPEVTEDN